MAVLELDPAQVPLNSFDAELWIMQAAYVEDWQHDTHQPKQHPSGTIHSHAVTTNDGHTYPVIVGEARKQVSDIPVAYTTAWWTHTHGYNRHVLLRLMEHGFNGVLIGSEGTTHEVESSVALLHSLGSISLASSADNLHAVLDGIPEVHDQQTDRIALIGASRGAMVGLGVMHQALLAKHDRIVERADLTAPCFPKKFECSDIPELLGQIVSEPQHVLRFLSKISLGTVLHYPSTIDPHPISIAHQLATAGALFSGEAGDLARGIPLDQLLHLTTFKGDFASMPRRWDEIFEHHTNFTHDKQRGAHLSIANMQTITAIEQRLVHAIMAGVHAIEA